MRFVFAALFFSACAGSADRDVAWPKAHTTETDGGQSLAPHEARIIAAVAKADDDKPAVPTVTAAPAAAAVEAAPAAVVAAPAAATEETIQSEEIIIEIDD